MNEQIKRLIFAVENIDGLLAEGLTDTQNENWKGEIDELYEALSAMLDALDMGKKP